jgi:hypothetical protein
MLQVYSFLYKYSSLNRLKIRYVIAGLLFLSTDKDFNTLNWVQSS